MVEESRDTLTCAGEALLIMAAIIHAVRKKQAKGRERKVMQRARSRLHMQELQDEGLFHRIFDLTKGGWV